MPHYVYSTLSSDVVFTHNATAGKVQNAPHDCRRILVRGGANVAKTTNIGGLYTPRGFVTEVSDKQKEVLDHNVHFQRYVKRGFIKVEDKKLKVEKGVSNLEPKDKSAPYTPKEPPRPGVEEAENPNKKK